MGIGLLCSFLFLGSCSDFTQSKSSHRSRQNLKGEYIYRNSEAKAFSINNPEQKIRDNYPWEEGQGLHYTKITKEYFRCRGSGANPSIKEVSKDGKPLEYLDCEGGSKHSLPLIDGKEGIYPILIDLLNYIQKKTEKRVMITCGHRCPEHNIYADRSRLGRVSKHMIGAEVDFYVQGMENEPQKVINIIMAYYRENPAYYGQEKYQTFKRYEKGDAHVAVQPWYNNEIYMKLVGKNEGRDFDNSHPYPYINIQVRYDRQRGEKVQYSWEKAHKGYLRWQ